MDDSRTDRNRIRDLIAELDVVLLLLFFAGMLVVANDYHPVARQFPVLFLGLGLAAMALELLVVLLPDKYSNRIDRLTTGLAADMDTDLAIDEEESAPADSGRDGTYRTIATALGLIVGFGLLSYYISFILATPIFVFGSIYTLGSRSFKNALLTTIVLLVGIYGLFGEVMNVPIEQGELVSFDQLLDLVMMVARP